MIRWMGLICIGLLIPGCSMPSVRLGEPQGATGTLAAQIAVGNWTGTALRIYYLGDPPRLVSPGRFRGAGLLAFVCDNQLQEKWHVTTGEADDPIEIDYGRAADGVLVITYFTGDPRTPLVAHVFFVEETVRLTSSKAVVDRRLLLAGDPKRLSLAELTTDCQLLLRQSDEQSVRHFRDNAERVRNIGLLWPEDALAVLDDLSVAADGEYSYIINKCIGEVTMAMSLNK